MPSYMATVLAKGQLTVPAEIREKLGLKAGDRLEFQLLRDGTALVRALNVTVDELFASVPYTGEAKTIDEIDRGIAEGATDGETVKTSDADAAA